MKIRVDFAFSSRLSEVSVLYQFRPPLSVHIENRQRWRVYERTVYRPPENSKSLSWSSVRLAFMKAMESQSTVFARPKEIADVRGISYSYSLLWHFGVIKVPEEVESKMQGKRR